MQFVDALEKNFFHPYRHQLKAGTNPNH